jgi:hypothetical protein
MIVLGITGIYEIIVAVADRRKISDVDKPQ